MLIPRTLQLLAAFFINDPLNDLFQYFSLSGKDVYDTSWQDGRNESHPRLKIDNMTFSDVTWISSHNAHANEFAASDNVFRLLATNQQLSVYKQLKEGVRGLLLDIEYKDGSLICVHAFVEFSLLRDLVMNEIIPFLDEDKDAIITLDFETRGVVELIRSELGVLLEQTPNFTNRIFRFNSENWLNHTDWPTIAEMIAADQRVIILVDNAIVTSNEMGIYFRSNVTMENHWKGGLDSCSPRGLVANLDLPWSTPYITGFDDKHWTRLFTMNHFCCSTGIESLYQVNPSRIGGGDNGWGVLFPRIMLCIAESKMIARKPNFIAVDWVNIGDVKEVVDYMNFGGRLGVGQKCESGLDCATGSCSMKTNQCHCQLCASSGCGGCEVYESCVTIEEGVNVCTTPNYTEKPVNNTATIEQPILTLLFILLCIII